MPDDSYLPQPSPGEMLLQSLFRLPRLTKINLPNSPLVMESYTAFKTGLDAMCGSAGQSILRIYHGRFHANEDRVAFNCTLPNVVNAWLGFFQDRDIQGLRLFSKPDLTVDDIVGLAAMLTQAKEEKEPVLWIKGQLEAQGIKWVQVMLDQDFQKSMGHAEGEQMPEQLQAQALAAVGRKIYAQTLKSFVEMGEKLGRQEKVGIQKSKRAVQALVEIMMENEGVVLGLSTIRDYEDYTFTHSINVALLAMCLGHRLGLGHNDIGQLGLCGLFHDLGKLDMPADLVQKATALTDAEFEAIRRHSINSLRQIIRMNAEPSLKSKLLVPPFEYHQGLRLPDQTQIKRQGTLSLFGRIIAVVDQYDAMTSSRAYRQTPIRPDQALQMMMDQPGNRLDPVILKVFVNMMGIYPVGTLLFLDTKEIGMALATPKGGDSERPVVRLLVREEQDKLVKGELVELSELDEETGTFKRNISRCFHPSEYGLQPADYLY